MESLATPIENAAEQTAAAVAETAAEAAETLTPAVETAAANTEDATTGIADKADEATVTVTETLATTTEPAPEAPASTCQMIPTLLIAALAGVVVLVIIIAALARRKKGGQSQSSKTNDSNGNDVVEIYVGNLSYDMTDAQLRREFERYGVVKSARVITNRSNNKSKGYGFVEMPHRKEALIAIKALDNAEVMARRIRVNEARANTKPPENR